MNFKRSLKYILFTVIMSSTTLAHVDHKSCEVKGYQSSSFSWSATDNGPKNQRDDIEIDLIGTKTADDVCVMGVRLKNPGSKPIIMVHGFLENLTIFNGIAQELYDRGYDVYLFNMRGHGNGARESKALREKTLMGFDEIVSFDIPAMLRYVHKMSAQKATIIGHSMGTMSSRLTVSGVGKDLEGNMIISEDYKNWALDKVSGVIAISSPSSLRNSDEVVSKFFSYDSDEVNVIRQRLLNILFFQRDPANPSNTRFGRIFNQYVNWATEKAIRYGIPRYFLDTLFRLENFNFSTFELSTLVLDSMSVPSDRLYADASLWSREKKYASRDGRINYENLPVPKEIPYYFIGVTEDGLANLGDMKEDFLSQPKHDNMALITVKDFGHMDIVATEKGKVQTLRILKNILDSNFSKDSLEFLKLYTKIDVFIK